MPVPVFIRLTNAGKKPKKLKGQLL